MSNMTETQIHDCGYPVAAHADFDLNGKCVIELPDEAPMCQWYALCDHLAVGSVHHPILGDVPICQRCADKHDMTVEASR